jgi:hypothetical protein
MKEGYFDHIHRDGNIEVVSSIQTFYENKYPKCEVCGEPAVQSGIDGYSKFSRVDVGIVTHIHEGSDLILNYQLQIECKDSKYNGNKALSQTMNYYQNTFRSPEIEGLYTFLAVPDDYRDLEKILAKINEGGLPIGVLLVKHNGNIIIKKEAKGYKKMTKYVNYPYEPYIFLMKSIK